jgi:RNA polymerase sigma-70 factor (ECF subfamily)
MNLLEKGIWESIKEGDLKSFELLFNTYYKGLRIYAMDILKNKEDAEEIVLDMFTSLWDNKYSIQIHTSLKAYLYRGIHNRCINLIRRNEVNLRKGTNHESNLLESTEQDIMGKDDSALDNLIVLELENSIKAAIERLPKQCREIFTLSRFEQMKIRDIAIKLNLAESTVKTQLSRAIEKLHEILRHHMG